MLLRLEDVGKSFGARDLFAGVGLDVRAGDRVALVGPNGAGKTTLLRIAAGLEAPDHGSVRRARGARVGMLRQEIDPSGGQSVRDEARRALAHLDALAAELGALEEEMARLGEGGGGVPPALAERYDRARTRFELGGGFAREARIDRVLGGLGFGEPDRDRPLRSFSGGWLMRVELAKLLLAEPDVLLLDEPTNHLDLPSIQWFEETLEAFAGAVVVISHDRTFLRRHARRVAELAAGRFTLYEGGFDRYLRERALRREQLEAQKRSQDRRIAETERFIERFRAKATKARQVQSRVKALEKIERVELEPDTRRAPRLRIPKPRRAGDPVMVLEDVHKSYGDTLVYRGVELRVRRGDRVALVGPNGAGKSTLLRILAGTLPFEHGERRPGHHVQVAFYAQHQLEVLDPGRTVLEELAAVSRPEDEPRLRGHLGAFLFSGDDVEKKVAVLSGGEKARLALARMLLRPSNFLVLDEPTNHLDVDACEVLERALRDYAGTLAFISHDRSFINALATRVVEVRAGTLREFPGDYDAYARALRDGGVQAAGAAAGAPAAGASVADSDSESPRDAGTRSRVPAPAGPATGQRSAATSEAGAAGLHATDRPTPVSARTARHAARDRERERRKAHGRARRRLASLEDAILERETEVENLTWRLADPAVHRDPDRVRELAAERDAARSEVDDLYRQWEDLAAEVDRHEQSP